MVFTRLRNLLSNHYHTSILIYHCKLIYTYAAQTPIIGLAIASWTCLFADNPLVILMLHRSSAHRCPHVSLEAFPI